MLFGAQVAALSGPEPEGMGFDLKTLYDLITLAIVVATCLAGLRQIKLNRSGNQLKAVLSIQKEFRGKNLQTAFKNVQATLAAKLQEPEYCAILRERGFVDPNEHPEILVCNWFEGVGVTVKYQLVSEDAFMDLYGRLVVYYWDLTKPAIALMRETRGRTQYHNFEYLAIRARTWIAKYPEGIFPRSHVRASLE